MHNAKINFLCNEPSSCKDFQQSRVSLDLFPLCVLQLCSPDLHAALCGRQQARLRRVEGQGLNDCLAHRQLQSDRALESVRNAN